MIKSMTMTKDTIKADLQKLLQDMNKTSEDAEKSLQKIDRKIAEIDLRYAKNAREGRSRPSQSR